MVLVAKQNPEFEAHLRRLGVGKLCLIPFKTKENYETFVKFRGILLRKLTYSKNPARNENSVKFPQK